MDTDKTQFHHSNFDSRKGEPVATSSGMAFASAHPCEFVCIRGFCRIISAQAAAFAASRSLRRWAMLLKNS
jgi:hypothetical protein